MANVIYVGYHDNMSGGVQRVAAIIRSYFPQMLFHASVKGYRSKFRSALFSVTAYFKFLTCLARYRPRLAHILVASPADQIRNLPYILFSRLAGLRVVLQFRYDIGPAFRRLPLPLRMVVRWFYGRSHCLCFLAEGLQDDFKQKVGKFPCVVIPNPIALGYLARPPLCFSDRKHEVIFLGRFCREKGIYDLLDAALLHMKHDSEIEYHFWGDGRRPTDIPSRCCFHRWIDGDEKLDVLRRAKVLVLPSHKEAFPNVILEAMSCGTPMVVTRVGGCPNQVSSGVQGLLVEPGDPAALLRGIRRIVEDRTFWETCSRNAWSSAQSYAADIICAKWHRLYTTVLGNRCGRQFTDLQGGDSWA